MWVGEMVWGWEEINSFGCFDEFELHFLSKWGYFQMFLKWGQPLMTTVQLHLGAFAEVLVNVCLIPLARWQHLTAPNCKGSWYTSWSIVTRNEFQILFLGNKERVGYWVTNTWHSGICREYSSKRQRKMGRFINIHKHPYGTKGQILCKGRFLEFDHLSQEAHL